MFVETLDKKQFSYFHVLNPFLKLTRPDQARPIGPANIRWKIAQLLNATHLLVYYHWIVLHTQIYAQNQIPILTQKKRVNLVSKFRLSSVHFNVSEL